MGCCQSGGVDTHGEESGAKRVPQDSTSFEALTPLELPTSEKRVVFVSLTSLNVFFRRLPAHVWDECLVCVNAYRGAVRRRLKKGGKGLFDCEWLASLSDELLHEVMQKDERGLVLWLNPSLKPALAWKQVSEQLQKIPVKRGSQQLLAPLPLDDKQFWKTRLTPVIPQKDDGSTAFVFGIGNDCTTGEWMSADYEDDFEDEDLDGLHVEHKNEESSSGAISILDLKTPHSPIIRSAAMADTCAGTKSLSVSQTVASRSVSRFGVTSTQVLTQLLIADSLNYEIACEMLYQSNPHYLIPMQNLDRKLYESLAAQC